MAVVRPAHHDASARVARARRGGHRRALRGGPRGHPSGRRDAVRHSVDGLDPGAGRARALSLLLLDVARKAHGGRLVVAVRRSRGGPHRRHPGACGRELRRQPQRVQRLLADGVGPGPGPWRRDARRRPPPRLRRARRARGADIGLARQPRLAARLAAPRLRAGGPGVARPARRAHPAPALSPHARAVAARPLRRHRDPQPRSRACGCSALHELARILYNHALMAISDDTACAVRRGRARADRGYRGRLGLFGARAHAPDRRPPAARAAHGPGALRGLRCAVAGGARALRRRLPLPAPRCEPRVRRGDRGRRHAGRGPRLRLPARPRLGLRADGAVPPGRARLAARSPTPAATRPPRRSRSRRSRRPGCWTPRSRSTASRASRAPAASRASSRT